NALNTGVFFICVLNSVLLFTNMTVPEPDLLYLYKKTIQYKSIQEGLSMINKPKVTPVFYVSLSIAFVLILWGAIFPANVETVLGYINDFISNKFGWVYMLAMTAFVIFAAFLVISPYGKIRLGKQNEKPQYNYFTWFSFLFTAGMGVGLVFYGVT